MNRSSKQQCDSANTNLDSENLEQSIGEQTLENNNNDERNSTKVPVMFAMQFRFFLYFFLNCLG